MWTCQSVTAVWVKCTACAGSIEQHQAVPTICYPLRHWKRVTKSLGRSRANWRKHHLGVILSVDCFWWLHAVGRLFYHSLVAHNPFWPINCFKNTFQATNWPTLTNVVSTLPSPFSQNGHLSYHLNLRGRNCILAWCTVLKLMSKQSSFGALSVGINNSKWLSWRFVVVLLERVTVVYAARRHLITGAVIYAFAFCFNARAQLKHSPQWGTADWN